MFAVLVFLVAGIVKGTVGIGLPTISISMMAQFADPRLAIALLLAPALVSNSWQVYRGGNVGQTIRRLWPYGLSLAVVLYFSSLFAPQVPTATLVAGIGVLVVIWVLTSFVREPPPVTASFDRPLQFICGVVSGAIGGLTAIWSPPMVMYLLASRCSKEDFVRYTGFLILCGTIPLTMGYMRNGLLDKTIAIGSILMIVPTLAGFAIGEKIRHRLGAEQFQKHSFYLLKQPVD